MKLNEGMTAAFPCSFTGGEGLSQREYAAIHLKVPDSGTEWLDAMIQKARRDEFAKAALSNMADWNSAPTHARAAQLIAAAMLEECR